MAVPRLVLSVFSGASPISRPEWLPAQVPNAAVELGASLLVVVLTWASARVLVRIFSRRIAQFVSRPSLTRVSLAAIRLGVYAFGLLTLLRINGLDLGNIALSVTVFSAVVGVILAPIVGSVISGVFLLADQPYEIGDMIELPDQGQGTRGFVDDITLRYTKVFTLDNTFLVVPNGEMRSRDVINYSAEDTRVRLGLDVLITYESDVKTARNKIEASARHVDDVISGGPRIRVGGARYPAGPDCLISEFGDHGVLLRLRYWATEPYRLQTVRSKVQTNIWDTLQDEENVEFAYPHSHMVFDDTSGQLQVGIGEGNTRYEDGPATRIDTDTDPEGPN
ncbi:mechanosensitive ion channel family protein [Halovenus halobia]|uniref:mechanosensitive ion channel family protein n=1 Tax=Halovenus halobia TaxID=3396622 RepID=UPI003F56C019